MAAAQRRLITAENSRLGKVPDLAAMLQSENAWSTLPRETREHLYALLPPADDSESERDPDVNPLLIARLKPYITEELTRFKEDLKDGKETKKWRADAMQVGSVNSHRLLCNSFANDCGRRVRTTSMASLMSGSSRRGRSIGESLRTHMHCQRPRVMMSMRKASK